jgi:hypothetical protein
MAQWIASLRDSRAKTSASLESVLGLREQEADCSTKSSTSQTSAERLTCFSKTCLACSAPPDIARDAYVAGIIDGEGSISIQKRGEVRVDVGMAEKAIPLLNWLYRNFGGTVRPTGKETEKWQARYCWTITTDPAICLLRLVGPHMTIKREIVDAILKADMVDRDLRRGKHRQWTEARFQAFEEARETALRVNKKGPPEDRGEWIARRVGNRWETKQGNLLTGLSETFSGNWPRAGSMRNGCVSERPTWVPVTAGQGGSALPGGQWMTPNVPNGGRHVPPELVDSKGMTADGQKRTVGLESQTKYWPTPQVGTGENSHGQISGDFRNRMEELLAMPMWATPRAGDGEKGGPSQAGSKGDLMLPSMAAQWPTPAARDYKGTNSAQHMTRTDGRTDGRSRNHADQLPNFIMMNFSHPAPPTPAGQESSSTSPISPRRLSPIFGEWLMGWPSQWTKAEPSASSASATELYRSALQQRLSSLFGEQQEQ